jgi:hypothetical protein
MRRRRSRHVRFTSISDQIGALQRTVAMCPLADSCAAAKSRFIRSPRLHLGDFVFAPFRNWHARVTSRDPVQAKPPMTTARRLWETSVISMNSRSTSQPQQRERSFVRDADTDPRCSARPCSRGNWVPADRASSKPPGYLGGALMWINRGSISIV